MKTIINVPIDSQGRPKPSSKVLCNQYETGVSEFNITLDNSWINSSYFYYLVVMPPEDSGVKQYAVPIIPSGNTLTFNVTSGITWHLGGYKFAVVAMSQELPDTGVIPTTGVVSITDVWEGEVNAIPFDIAQLGSQPVDPAFTLLYDNLLALKGIVEQRGEYAQLQGDYAKGEGDKVAAALIAVTLQGNIAENKGIAAETKGNNAQSIADLIALKLANGEFDGADGEGSGDMLKTDYDTNTDGVVNDSDKLGGQLPAYYAKTTDIPTTLPASDVSAWAKSATKPTYTKSEVGLGNVDNTSDADKPVSTAINALFRNLQGDLYTTDRYNTPLSEHTVTYSVVTADYIPSMTSNSMDGFTLTSNSIVTAYPPYYAFDGDDTTYYSSNGYARNGVYVQIKLDKMIIAKSVHLKIRPEGKALRTFAIQASNDSAFSTYDTLFSHADTDVPFDVTYELNNNNQYLYYRLYVTAVSTSTGYLHLTTFQITEYSIETKNDYLTLSDIPLTSYENGKIVNIKCNTPYDSDTKMPIIVNPYLNINNLGNKIINGTLEDGKLYSLKYNGISWDILQDFIVGTYTGNSTENNGSQDIDLGFKPKILFASAPEGQYPVYLNIQAENFNYNTNKQKGSSTEYYGIYEGAAGSISLNDTGFTARNGSYASDNYGYNYKNIMYSYIAFK